MRARGWFAKSLLIALSVLSAACGPGAPRGAVADEVGPPVTLIDQTVIDRLRAIVASPVVRIALEQSNRANQALDSAVITTLDKAWVAEGKAARQPLVTRIMASPLSAYAVDIQAAAVGLYVQVLFFDERGLNVGISTVTSDYWQGDEAKFKKTVPVAADAVFIDEPEQDDEFKIWVAQVSLAIPDAAKRRAIGAVTFEINLTELARRRAAGV